MLILENVGYDSTTKKVKKRILDDISLTFPKGKIIALLGRNGAGKTTLFDIIAGNTSTNIGYISYNGVPGRKARYESIVYIPDDSILPLALTPSEICEFFSFIFPDFDRKKALDNITFFNIPEQKVLLLSKGEVSKLQLACLLARTSDYYLIDEPLAGIDAISKDAVVELIIRAARPDSTIIISTHQLKDAGFIFDTAHILHAGRIRTSIDCQEMVGSLDDLFKEVLKDTI